MSMTTDKNKRQSLTGIQRTKARKKQQHTVTQKFVPPNVESNDPSCAIVSEI